MLLPGENLGLHGLLNYLLTHFKHKRVREEAIGFLRLQAPVIDQWGSTVKPV